MAEAAAVEELEVEAGGVAELNDGGRREGEGHGVLDGGEMFHGAPGDGLDAIFGARAERPVLQADEGEAGALAAAGEAETGDGEDAIDGVFFLREEVVADVVENGLGAVDGGAGRGVDQHEHDALVFLRQEGGGDAGEEVGHAPDDHDVNEKIGEAAAEDVFDAGFVVAVGGVEAAIEKAKDATRFLLMALFDLLKEGGAEGGSEDEGDHDGEEHGRDDGDGELAVDDAGRAGEEGHRDEDGGEDEGDADERTGDLRHGFARGLAGREAFLGHDALDVLDDDNGVIDEEADGEDHAEHGERVDGKASELENRESAEEDDGDGNGGDEGGAEILQEDEHDDEDEEDGLEEGLHDFLDGDPDERRGVVGIDGLEAAGEEGRELVDGVVNVLGGLEGVGSGGELDGEAGGGVAVELALKGVVFGAELDAGDVADADLRAVRIDLEEDGAELVGVLKARRADDGGVELLILGGGETSKFAGSELDVLGEDGGGQVAGREGKVVQLGGVHPDAHGVLGTEELEVADAGGAGDGVLHGGGNEVGDVDRRHGVVLGNEADDEEEVLGRLGDADALLLDFLREERGGKRELVLDLDLRDVGVGALRETQGDGHRTVLVALRGEVEEVVDAAKLLLDDLDDGALDGFRGGAGIVDGDGDGRGRDGGILRDGERLDGEAAGQHQDDGDDPGENGAVDEELGEHGLGHLSGGGLDVVLGHFLRDDGGARRDLLQAADNDAVAGGEALSDEPLVADGAVGLDVAELDLIARADEENAGLPPRIAHDALLRHEDALVSDAFLDMGGDEHAGKEKGLGIGKDGAEDDRAGALIDGDFAELERARLFVGRAILQGERDGGFLVADGLDLARGDFAPQAGDEHGGLGDIDVDRVELLDGDEGGGLIGRDESAFGDGAPGATGDGREDLGVGEIDLRGLDGGLGGGDVGEGLRLGGHGGVVVGLADGVAALEGLVTVGLRLGDAFSGLGVLQLGERAVERGLIGGRVDLVELVAFLDVRAFGEHARLQDAVNLWADFGDAEGRGAAREVGGQGDGLGLQGDDADVLRGLGAAGWSRAGRSAGITGSERQGGY